MTLFTAVETSISWGLSPIDTISMQRSTSHGLFSHQVIRTVSVSYCTLCPRLDGPSDHVNERAIRSDTIAVTLSNYICRGFYPLPCVYRPRSRLCSSTTNLFSSDKIASRSSEQSAVQSNQRSNPVLCR